MTKCANSSSFVMPFWLIYKKTPQLVGHNCKGISSGTICVSAKAEITAPSYCDV